MNIQETARDVEHAQALVLREGFPALGQAALTALEYSNEYVIKRLMKDQQMSREEAELLFQDMLKFLCLSGARTGVMLTPPHQIDVAWHAFILFTLDYTNFCQKYFGRYLHHQPSITLLDSTCKGSCTCSADMGSDEPVDRQTSLEATDRLARANFAPLSSNWSVQELT